MSTKITSQPPAKVISQAEANTKFVESFKNHTKDGGNDILADFLEISNHLIPNVKSFTFADFIGRGKYKDLPMTDIEPLFDRWTKFMIAAGRFSLVNGCYDSPVFRVNFN